MAFALGNRAAVGNRGGGILQNKRDRMLTRALIHECDQVDNSGPDKGRNGYTKIARRLIREAAERGNVEAAKLIWSRLEGLPQQNVNLAVSGETKQLTLNVSLGELSDIGSKMVWTRE
jgi:hypothetical protein